MLVKGATAGYIDGPFSTPNREKIGQKSVFRQYFYRDSHETCFTPTGTTFGSMWNMRRSLLGLHTFCFFIQYNLNKSVSYEIISSDVSFMIIAELFLLDFHNYWYVVLHYHLQFMCMIVVRKPKIVATVSHWHKSTSAPCVVVVVITIQHANKHPLTHARVLFWTM